MFRDLQSAIECYANEQRAKVIQKIRKRAYGDEPFDSYAAYRFYGDPRAKAVTGEDGRPYQRTPWTGASGAGRSCSPRIWRRLISMVRVMEVSGTS